MYYCISGKHLRWLYCQVQQSHNVLNIIIFQNCKMADTVGFPQAGQIQNKNTFYQEFTMVSYVYIHTVKHLAMHILSQFPTITTETDTGSLASPITLIPITVTVN